MAYNGFFYMFDKLTGPMDIDIDAESLRTGKHLQSCDCLMHSHILARRELTSAILLGARTILTSTCREKKKGSFEAWQSRHIPSQLQTS
jgi:hypothetical protein